MTLGVGIIGTGGIADACHGPAVAAAGLELRAVLSRDVSRGQAFLDRHSSGGGQAYADLEQFLKDDSVSLVIVCSPDRLHFEQIKACLQAGKNVLAEKPLTTSVAEAEELVALAAEHDVVLATGFHLRSHVGHRLLIDKIRSGEVGEVRHVRVIWAFPQVDNSNWRAHDELGRWWSLAAVGSHCVDLARWFAGDFDDWRSLSPTIANNLWNGSHDETAVVGGQLSNGVTVEVVSSVQFGPALRIEVYGSGGVAICDDTLGRAGAGAISLNGSALQFEAANPFVAQLRNVAATIEDSAELNASGIDGLRSVKDLDLIA